MKKEVPDSASMEEKKKMKKTISALLMVAVLALGVFAGCGKAAEEQGATSADIQPTLVYFGSLKATDNDNQFAVFRNDAGDLVYLFEFDGTLDYGIPVESTGTATTADGQEYTTVTLGDIVYGYAFTDTDATEGFIVDKDGNVYQAKELGEDGARALVDKTL